MKKHIIFSILLATILFTGCKKDDGMLPKDLLATLDAVPQPSVVQNGGSGSIDMLNLAGFQGKFDVKLLYPNDIQPAKLDVVIMKNENKGNIKVFQAGVTTLPSSFTITAAQLASLFGAPIALGDNYDIGVDIYTQKGNKYQAFPTTGAAYGATGVANQPGFSPVLRYGAICAYDPAIYQGNFEVVSDAFGDFSPGEIVVLTKVSNTQFSFIDPYVTSPLPIIVTINTGNNNISITKQKIGNAFVWNTSYTNPNAAATSGFVAPCDKKVTLNIAYTVDQGSFGTFALVLRKP